MPVNHSIKTIFIHIPKTAGTSIESALGMHGHAKNVGVERYLNQEKDLEHLFGKGLQHLTAREIQKHLGKKLFTEYFKFTVIRNPYDRLVSYVAWLNGKWETGELLTREYFTDFLKKEFNRNFLRKSSFPQEQYNYLYVSGKLAPELILRYENLEEGLNLLKQRLNLPFSMDTRMQSVHEDYRFYYTKELYRQIYRYYTKDFAYFNYPEM